jgi:hypothetical protein
VREQARKLNLHVRGQSSAQGNFQRAIDSLRDYNVVEHSRAETTREVAYSRTFSNNLISAFYRVLTMAYNTQNYWVFELCPSSGILKTREYMFPSSGEVGITYSVRSPRKS